MEEEFYRYVDTGAKYRKYLTFVKWFFPAWVALFTVVVIAFPDRFTREDLLVLALCMAGGGVILWVSTFPLSKVKKSEGQTWTVRDGRAIHRSPSKMLGESFDIALDDIRKVDIDGSERFRCTLKNGEQVTFLDNDKESQEFYDYLKRYVAERG